MKVFLTMDEAYEALLVAFGWSDLDYNTQLFEDGCYYVELHIPSKERQRLILRTTSFWKWWVDGRRRMNHIFCDDALLDINYAKVISGDLTISQGLKEEYLDFVSPVRCDTQLGTGVMRSIEAEIKNKKLAIAK